MKAIRKIDIQVAGRLMLAVLSCVVVFHLLVLSGAIPFSVVWGGRLESPSQMYAFEAASIAINLVVMALVGMRMGYMKPIIHKRAVSYLLLIFAVLFSINTVGNLLATTTIETIVFTPVTLLGAVLCYRMAIDDDV